MTQYMQHTHEAVGEFIECKMSQSSGRNLFPVLLQNHVTAWHAVKHCSFNYGDPGNNSKMVRDHNLL